MIHFTTRILQIVGIAGCVTSSAYYLFCLWSAGVFLRDRKRACRNSDLGRVSPEEVPPVSILKPLKGTDPDIYASFRSHCVQDYPSYELIFGVSDTDDPAVSSVHQLQREFPQLTIRIVVCSKRLGENGKVSNLEQMLEVARFDHLVVNDSDIRVETDYIRRVMLRLTDPSVGMVTSLYRGVPTNTLGSKLESLGIGTDFCPGVLVACELENGIRFGLGSTMAFRRTDLQKIGGFHSLVDYLADDYELGRRIADLGLQVRLSDVVVETHLPSYDFRGFAAHQTRWARGVRDSRLGGYIGLVLTFGLLWALLIVVASHAAPWAWVVLGIVGILRLAVALVVGRSVLRDRTLIRNLWLLPARDLIAVGVWISSFFGHTVTWRGDRFRLRNGRLARINS